MVFFLSFLLSRVDGDRLTVVVQHKRCFVYFLLFFSFTSFRTGCLQSKMCNKGKKDQARLISNHNYHVSTQTIRCVKVMLRIKRLNNECLKRAFNKFATNFYLLFYSAKEKKYISSKDIHLYTSQTQIDMLLSQSVLTENLFHKTEIFKKTKLSSLIIIDSNMYFVFC